MPCKRRSVARGVPLFWAPKPFIFNGSPPRLQPGALPASA